MDGVIDTLFAALEGRGFDEALERGPVAFLNARYHPFLENLKKDRLFLQQYFRPYAAELKARGFSGHADFEAAGQYSIVLILSPKNAVEAEYLAARGLSMLKPGGALVAAAGNKAGGTRLKKTLAGFGLDNVGDISKNRARAAWGAANKPVKAVLGKAIKAGAMRKLGPFYTQPGIFSWDRIDRGSAILAEHLPPELKGHGADFGCGFGFLSHQVLTECGGVESIACIDADWRAAEACRRNLSGAENARFLWEDLTKPMAGISNLDWIVMNPPFHEGKAASPGIGVSFIKTASSSLKPGGALWMVANANLPYEAALSEYFSSHEKIFEGQGFKVLRAQK